MFGFPAFAIITVSIHAPARGATQRRSAAQPCDQFQSTHPQGVRLLPSPLMHHCFVFQSTHPQGVRHQMEAELGVGIEFQSTHPQGVRPGTRRARCRLSRFNPRTRKCDALAWCSLKYASMFQSTHPQGCDVAFLQKHRHLFCFNPRTRKTFPYCVTSSGLFQSTHPQGVPYYVVTPLHAFCFNPRTRKVRQSELKRISGSVSIHAPARVRHLSVSVNRLKYVSITPARGATAICEVTGRTKRFNPRTRKVRRSATG